MSPEFELLKSVFDKNGWTWEYSDELQRNISIARKNDMLLFNYNDAVLVPRNHPVLVRCRGLVINLSGELINYPFDRFFNTFEKEATVIDWSLASAQDKLDGSLLNVFWNGSDWEVTTRGSFYPREDNSLDFAAKFKSLFNNFDKLNTNCCYMFEMISKDNRIVTWYDNEFVVLIGCRSKSIGWLEYDSLMLDEIAGIIGATRPNTCFVTNLDDCTKLFSGLRPDEEGLVIVDLQNNRIKMKQESYIRMARIKMLRDDDIFDYVMGRAEIDQEFLKKCPDVEQKIVEMRTVSDEVFTKISFVTSGLISSGVLSKDRRKAFALESVKYPFKKIMFSLIDQRNFKDYVCWDDVVLWKKYFDAQNLNTDETKVFV